MRNTTVSPGAASDAGRANGNRAPSAVTNRHGLGGLGGRFGPLRPELTALQAVKTIIVSTIHCAVGERFMGRRELTRRAALRALGLGAVGTVAASTGAAATQETPNGQRDDDRIQFVEADPEAGFNFPYWLATPETFRSEPVPLLVTMNSATPGQPLLGGGQNEPTTVAQRARSEVQSLQQTGAWASEHLGVPQLVPVFPLPDGDPVDRTHRTIQLDRETMLIEGTTLERIDRQLLRMTEHARQQVLGGREMHDQLLFWGNSSAGQAAEHMAVLHPREIMAFAAAGINGIVTLPLETLGSHTLKYPIGVADLEAITGEPFDAEAFDRVNKFYILGAHDTHKRLKFHVPGELPGTWADPEIYETAKAVYGFDMDQDSLPRCHIAFEKAGVSGQFRIYPEMTHYPTDPAAPDVLEFLRRSINGEDVSEFGQRLTLPFDRTVELLTAEPAVGDPLQFAVSGQYPPPAGLVEYTWQVDDGRMDSGQKASFTFEDSGAYELTLAMETAHGQVAQRGMSLRARGSTIGALQYAVTPPRTELLVGQSMLTEIDVTSVGSASADHRLKLFVDGEQVDSRGVALNPDESARFGFSYPFQEPGEFEVRIPPAYKQTISVRSEATPTPTPLPTPTPTRATTEPAPTPTPSSSPTEPQETTGTSAQTPGFGVLTAIVGIASAVSYVLLTDPPGEE